MRLSSNSFVCRCGSKGISSAHFTITSHIRTRVHSSVIRNNVYVAA
uniref:Uncharacterized protein n=1 Tax=Anguilla anguilla TaxID=7936 RepID=A0A0E9QWG9_ANGAN